MYLDMSCCLVIYLKTLFLIFLSFLGFFLFLVFRSNIKVRMNLFYMLLQGLCLFLWLLFLHIILFLLHLARFPLFLYVLLVFPNLFFLCYSRIRIFLCILIHILLWCILILYNDLIKKTLLLSYFLLYIFL